MNKKIGVVVCIMALVLGTLLEDVQAAKLIKNSEKTYAFVSVDGEACSATVNADVTQEYTEQGSIRSYKDRWGYIGYKYVATYTIPKVTYSSDPKFVDSNDKTIKTFSPWTHQDTLVSIDTHVVYT